MQNIPQLYHAITLPNPMPTRCTQAAILLQGRSIDHIFLTINAIDKETLREILEVVAPHNESYFRSNNVAFFRNLSKEKLLFYIACERCTTMGMRETLYQQHEAIQEAAGQSG